MTFRKNITSVHSYPDMGNLFHNDFQRWWSRTTNNKLKHIDTCNWACYCLSVSWASPLTRTPDSFVHVIAITFFFLLLERILKWSVGDNILTIRKTKSNVLNSTNLKVKRNPFIQNVVSSYLNLQLVIWLRDTNSINFVYTFRIWFCQEIFGRRWLRYRRFCGWPFGSTFCRRLCCLLKD